MEKSDEEECLDLNKYFLSENEADQIDLAKIDYVIAYSEYAKNETIRENRENYLANLEKNGLKLKSIQDIGKDGSTIIYVLIETPVETLFEIAEKIKLKLPIAENDLYMEENSNILINHRLECFIPEEIEIRDSYRKYFTAPYCSVIHDKFKPFFNKHDNLIIPKKDRCLIAYEILSRTSFSNKNDPSIFTDNVDDNIGVELLVANKSFSAAYPLHEDYGRENHSHDHSDKKTTRQLLWDYWAKPKSIIYYQPIHLIRQYFGEKLAFYFSWLGFYTSWLLFPSIIGLFVFIYGCSTVPFDIPTNEICNDNINGSGKILMCPLCDNAYCKYWQLHHSCLYSKITYLVDNPATIFFSIFMAVWTVLFIEFWKREQSKLQFEWDITTSGRDSMMIRPEFEIEVNEKRINPITKELEPFVPLRTIIKRYVFSVTCVLFMICLVLALVFGVIIYRVVLMIVLSRSENIRKYSGPITSLTAASINLFIIIVLGRLYAWVAVKLTDMEYHRTDGNYEDSLTIKMYLFQFVNYYASIFYIAFFKGRHSFFLNYVEPCDQSGCLIELCIQLAIIMVGKQVLNNIQEVLYPIVQNYINRRKNNQDYKQKQSAWKEDHNLMNWSTLTLFDEYLEMVIQFGFITLFVVAFPLGPLFAFLNNILEIRIDAFKVLTQLQRPIPRPSKDIGIWLPILNIISKLGVITNGAIIAFTSEFIPRLVYFYGYGNGSLHGYVNFTLSVRDVNDTNLPFTDFNTTTCRYRDYKEPYTSENKYEFTSVHYQILAARLLFLVVFEHLVFFIVSIMHMIPDVPNHIKSQIEREKFIAQKALWQVRPAKKGFNNIQDLTKRKLSKIHSFVKYIRAKPDSDSQCSSKESLESL